VPSMDSHSPERMVEIIATLSVLGDVLTDLIVKLASATPNEIPELRAQAEALTQRVASAVRTPRQWTTSGLTNPSPATAGPRAGAPTPGPEGFGGYCILAVAAGGRGRGLTGFFAAGSSITTTGLGSNTGVGPVMKLPSDMVE
jgi:hypothetical protein